jgi:EmrB/QacA subfamily drug resistance transporter
MVSVAHRSSYQVTFAVLLIAVMAYALLQSLVVPVLSTLQYQLHTSQSTVTWVLTAYLLSAAVFTPILGRVGDMIGKRRVFVATLAALAAGSLVAAVASSIGVMIVARVLQGVGGGILPLAFGIIRDEFPHEKILGAVGITSALIAVGGGLGIVLAGPIVNTLDYHWLFWIPLIVCTGAGVAAYVLVPESPTRTAGTVSVLAALLLSSWLVALLLAVSEGSSWGWTSARTLGLAAAAVVLAVLWILVELRSAQPLIDMRMMRIPVVWTTNLVALLFGAGMYAVFAFLPEFVQTPRVAGYGFGASITESGLFLLPMTVTMFLTGLVSGRLAYRLGMKALLVIGAAISMVPFVLLVLGHSQRWEIYLATAILGLGFGTAFAAMSNIIVAAVPRAQTGVASGMNANIRTIGGSIGAALMAAVVTANVEASGLPKESGYTHGFALMGALMVAAALAALLVPLRRAAQAADLQQLTAVEGPGAGKPALELPASPQLGRERKVSVR